MCLSSPFPWNFCLYQSLPPPGILHATLHATQTHDAVAQDELARYDASLATRPTLVIANKVDLLPPSAAAAALSALKAATQLPILPVSAQEGLGLDRLRGALRMLAGLRQ